MNSDNDTKGRDILFSSFSVSACKLKNPLRMLEKALKMKLFINY